MLVATFGPSTGWAGKTITFEDDHFVLEGHGPITAHDVMEYDSQGNLVWANDGTRAWVGSQTRMPSAWVEGTVTTSSSAPPSGVSSRTKGIISACLLIAIVIAVAVPMIQSQNAKSNAVAVDDGIHAVRIAIMSYAVDNNDAYPDPSTVSSSGLATFADEWPTNPYTGTPMKQGAAPGDFTYALGPDGKSFTLIGYGGTEPGGLSQTETVGALESTHTYGDGVWGQMPGTSMEMIAVKVPADSDTGNMDYWVRSRMDSSSEWSEGMFYGSADQAVDALVSGAQIERFSPWVGDAVQEP